MDTDTTSSDLVPPGVIRAMVVSDDGLSGLGIAGQLGDLVTGGVAGSRDPLAEAVRASGATVVVWDLGMDGRRLSDGMPDLESPGAPVVALLPDESWAGEALGAGARGVLLRDAGGGALRATVHAVAHGLVVMEPAMARALPRWVTPTSPRGTPADELTAREVEVLQRLAEGLANKHIATRLGISENTVKFHVNAILLKLGVASRTEAVVRAARMGLVML